LKVAKKIQFFFENENGKFLEKTKFIIFGGNCEKFTNMLKISYDGSWGLLEELP
jgi:hypothetical protein